MKKITIQIEKKMQKKIEMRKRVYQEAEEKYRHLKKKEDMKKKIIKSKIKKE